MSPPRAEVALNARPVAGELLLVPRGDRRNAGPFKRAGPFEMGVTHKAQARDSNPQHALVHQSLKAKKKTRSMRTRCARVKHRRPDRGGLGSGPRPANVNGRFLRGMWTNRAIEPNLWAQWCAQRLSSQNPLLMTESVCFNYLDYSLRVRGLRPLATCWKIGLSLWIFSCRWCYPCERVIGLMTAARGLSGNKDRDRNQRPPEVDLTSNRNPVERACRMEMGERNRSSARGVFLACFFVSG